MEIRGRLEISVEGAEGAEGACITHGRTGREREGERGNRERAGEKRRRPDADGGDYRYVQGGGGGIFISTPANSQTRGRVLMMDA